MVHKIEDGNKSGQGLNLSKNNWVLEELGGKKNMYIYIQTRRNFYCFVAFKSFKEDVYTVQENVFIEPDCCDEENVKTKNPGWKRNLI